MTLFSYSPIQCETVLNQGFKRGSYVCTCKRGFYFPDALAPEKAFNGSVIEREHDRMLRGESNAYENNFDCRRCSEGCDECVDGSPCIYTLKIVIRLLLCCLNGAVMVLTIVFAVYVALHWKDKVFKQRISRARYDCLGNGFNKFPIFFCFNRSSCIRLYSAYTLHILEMNERCARKMRTSRDLSDTRV